jgi:hypothetical protein
MTRFLPRLNGKARKGLQDCEGADIRTEAAIHEFAARSFTGNGGR